MRLLIDQNLPPRIARALAELYPGSLHVRDVELSAAPDAVIWDFASQHGFAIASKDSDFKDLAFLAGPPPKVVWVRRGNCSAQELAKLVCSHASGLREFLVDVETGLLTID